MEILAFQHSDQQSVARFWKDIYDELGWKITPEEGFDDIPAFFHFPKGFLLVIKDDEKKIVGCGGVFPLTNTTGVLKRFYIDPSLRGTGLAKQLLDKLIAESKKRELSKLVLDVYYTNTRAAKFYEKHGFVKYNQEPNPLWRQSLAPDKFFYYQMAI